MPLLTDIPNYFKKTFKGATAFTAGLIGLVPAPGTGQQNTVLKGDATWASLSASDVSDLATVATTGDYDDLTNKPTLGNSSALNVGTTTGTVAAGDDSRFTDARTPLSHASSHAAAGSDPLAPSDIGAQSLFASSSQALSADITLSASRAQRVRLENYNGTTYNVTLPTTDVRVGDVFIFTTGTLVGAQTIRRLNFGSNYTTLATISFGQSYRIIFTGTTSGSWQIDPVFTHTHAAADIASGTLTHERGGLEADVSAYDGLVKISGGSTSAVGIGTGSTQVAAGDHTHGNITNDGKVGSTAGLPLVTTTAGAVTTLALGNAGQVLKVNSGGTAVEFGAGFDAAAPPAIGSTTPAAGTFTTLAANNGTITASAPVLDLAQTWNNSGVAFTGVRVNVTNTASSAASRLLRLQFGGTDRVSVLRTGGLDLNPENNTPTINLQENWQTLHISVGSTTFGSGTTTALRLLGVGSGNSRIQVYATQGLELRQSADLGLGSVGAFLIADSEHALAQRFGTNPQEQRLYSTFTSSTNYQRMTVKSVRQTLSALSGASATTTGTFIPDGAVVVGVTTRVSTLITGATGYTIGDGTDADRWGDITATAVGSTTDNRDWTAGTIECFTAGGNITLTAKGSNFTAGAVEVSVFYLAGEAD